MDNRVINIFLEDGQKREYLINSKHTVERFKAAVTKDHDPTFGGTVDVAFDDDFYGYPYTPVEGAGKGGGGGGGGGGAGGGSGGDGPTAVGDYRLSVVTFYADRGEFTMRNLEREKDEILLYIMFPSENPQRPRGSRARGSRRASAAAQAAAERETSAHVRYELLFHRAGATIDLSERKFVGMFVPQSSTHKTADLINHLTVRIASPDMAGNLRKFSEKRSKWQKKYFMLKHDILWYCASREDQTDRKSISLVGVDPIVKSATYKNCFEINAPLRVYVLAAESAEDMNAWVKRLNTHRKDANQNNHIQLAEFFTSDYESTRTSKEHNTIQDCYLSFSRLLQNQSAAPLFKVFLAQLPQPARPRQSHAPLLHFYSDVATFCEDLEHKRRSVDQLWIVFEALGALLNPRPQQHPPVKPLAGVVLGDALVAKFNNRVASYRSRRAKLVSFNANLDSGSVPPPNLAFAQRVRDKTFEYLRTELYPRFLRTSFYKKWITAAPFKSV